MCCGTYNIYVVGLFEDVQLAKFSLKLYSIFEFLFTSCVCLMFNAFEVLFSVVIVHYKYITRVTRHRSTVAMKMRTSEASEVDSSVSIVDSQRPITKGRAQTEATFVKWK